MSAAPGLLLSGTPAVDPPGGLTYPLALRRDGFHGISSMFGIVVGLMAFAIFIPLASQLVLRVGHLLRGGDWEQYRQAAQAYQLPEGPVAGHLALALLIPISLLIVRYIHGVRPRWLASVHPGIRWRYLLLMVIVAVVVLNAVLWLGYAVKGGPTFHSGQSGWLTFLAFIAVTAPLQAAAEEVFFRGYLLQAIGSAAGRTWVGVVGSSLLFALMHGVQNPALFAHRLAFGLAAGALVVLTGGLEAGIAAHVVNNVAAYAYALFTTSVAELRAVRAISWSDAAWDISGFAVFAVVAWRIGVAMRLATRTP
ncbi:MAG: CPBP family intramembrane metalloprotease [Tessaracoccus sp.]|uniref:CPBP family intramembrane glutamic endopeptidase n=1 Tax=Tessaracoccus sp. TaxID=1971211 RepID=UPI001EC03595|nr:CPBP family intramembrane glutamic endopeptidase [Tessaracoccus sp.]MBK7821432.1 CPBP family intramembrane metalloprotease [Tessaracoccus sp.]